VPTWQFVPVIFLGLLVIGIGARSRRWIKERGSRSARWLAHAVSYFRTLFSRDEIERGSLGALLGRCATLAGAFSLMLPASMLMLMFSIFFGCVLLALMPMVGMAAGTEHIVQNVIGPKDCAPLRTRDQRLPLRQLTRSSGAIGRYATCVAVIKEGKRVDQGRVVFATSEGILLFSPDTGSVRRVPTKDAAIEVVPAI
jgi:hypothetical protein